MSLSPEPVRAHDCTLSLLGPLEIRIGGEALDLSSWPSRPRRLLSLLGSSPHRRRLREEVIDFIWPQATASAGASNLRHALHQLRRRMPYDPPPVLAHAGWVGLHPHWTWEIDVEALADAASRRTRTALTPQEALDLERAARLYRGEPLVEERFAEWAAPIRHRLQRQWRQICFDLSSHYLEVDASRSTSWSDLYLATADPLDEEMVELHLRALRRAGREAELRTVYRAFVQRFEGKMGFPPCDSLRILVESEPIPKPVYLQTSFDPGEGLRISPSYFPGSRLQFAGRKNELAQALDMLEGETRFNEGLMAIFVAAEAGVGKTHFLRELACRAGTLGAITLAGAAYLSEGRVPYGPVHDALLDLIDQAPGVFRSLREDTLKDLTEVVPELRHFLPSWDGLNPREQVNNRAFAAVARLFAILCQTAQVMLLLDDLQWSDEGTLQLIHFLSRRARRQASDAGTVRQPGWPLIIVAAYRPEGLTPASALSCFVDEFAHRFPIHHRKLVLGRLGVEELSSVPVRRLGSPL